MNQRLGFTSGGEVALVCGTCSSRRIVGGAMRGGHFGGCIYGAVDNFKNNPNHHLKTNQADDGAARSVARRSYRWG